MSYISDDSKCSFRFTSNFTGPIYHIVPDGYSTESPAPISPNKMIVENLNVLSLWRQQFVDAAMVRLLSHQTNTSWCAWLVQAN